ncbi:MAG: TauD/TfdA family dioxygenase [Alphaproteobacteria bacterium]
MTITVTPVSEILGADIAGLDMTAPLAPKDVAAIKQAFVDHLVLRFRGQALDARQLAAFSAQFGELQPHVQRTYHHPDDANVVEMRSFDEAGKFDLAGASRGATERLRDGWHSDLAYDAVPAKATFLHAVAVPSSGGNTCFANAHQVYEALPEALKQRIAGRRAEFSYGYNKRNKATHLAATTLDQAGRDSTTVTHPMVCVHPVTKLPALYVNPLVATRVVDMGAEDSDALLDELFDWLDRPEFRWEHVWRVGDTLMWENRGGVMHCGRLDYPRDQRRHFIRTTVRGQAIEAYQ